MRLYKRQIKPCYVVPDYYGRGNIVYGLENCGQWYDEDKINIKDKKWESKIRAIEKMDKASKYEYRLKWDERFVPIEQSDIIVQIRSATKQENEPINSMDSIFASSGQMLFECQDTPTKIIFEGDM